MAGFWTGLAHGTILCGATVAALSLAFPDAGRAPRAGQPNGSEGATSARKLSRAPVPADAPTGIVEKTLPPTPDPAQHAHVEEGGRIATGQTNTETGVEMTPLVDAAKPIETARTADATAAPGDVALPDPVGSEFRRGVDQTPAAPAPLQVGADWPATPHAAAPGMEPAPKAVEGLPGTPDTANAPQSPAGQAEGAESPQIAAPALDARTAPVQPAPVAVVTADQPPAPPSAAPEPGMARTAGDGRVQSAAASARVGNEPAAKPDAPPPPSDAQISAPAAPKVPAADAVPPLAATPTATPVPRDSAAPQDADAPRTARPAPYLRLPAPLGQQRPGGLHPATPDTRPDLSDLRAP